MVYGRVDVAVTARDAIVRGPGQFSPPLFVVAAYTFPKTTLGVPVTVALQ